MVSSMWLTKLTYPIDLICLAFVVNAAKGVNINEGSL